MDRGWERIGGWSSIAVGLAGVARIAIAISNFAILETRGPRLALAGGWPLLLAGIALAAAVAQGLVARSLLRALGPRTAILLTVTLGGYVAAMLAPVPALLLAYRSVVAPRPSTDLDLWVSLLAAFGTALWVCGACAIDWRVNKLPRWVRVVGTSYALLSFAAAILSPLVLLAVPLALAWWFGLGVALLAMSRATSSATA